MFLTELPWYSLVKKQQLYGKINIFIKIIHKVKKKKICIRKFIIYKI